MFSTLNGLPSFLRKKRCSSVRQVVPLRYFSGIVALYGILKIGSISPIEKAFPKAVEYMASPARALPIGLEELEVKRTVVTPELILLISELILNPFFYVRFMD